MIIWCQEMTELATDAMEGCLGKEKARAYRVHLALCPLCSAHRRQLETTIEVVRRTQTEAREQVPPAPSRERALSVFRKKK